MSITFKKVKEITNNFEGRNFWKWFLTCDQIGINTKAHILDWYMSEFYDNEDITNHMEDLGIIKGE